jgi:hypothetical protein
MQTTSNVIAEACNAKSVRFHVDGNREWAYVSTTESSEQAAVEFLQNTKAYLRSCGWEVCAFSNGFYFIGTQKFHTAAIDAMRGTGPRTEYENRMISTCTGRD